MKLPTWGRAPTRVGPLENRPVSWMTEAEKNGLLKLLENRNGHAAADREEMLRAKMASDAIDAQIGSILDTHRAAVASETAGN